MQVPTFSLPLSSMASPLPDLPAGPSLDGVRGPIEVSKFEPWQLTAVAFIALILLAFCIWHGLAYLRYRRQQKSALPPLQQAEHSLTAAKNIQEDRDFAAAHSQTFRDYLNAVLDMEVQGQTNEELSALFTKDLPINGNAVSQFLTRCDRVKFARSQLTEADRIHISDTATELIQSIESSRKQAIESKEVAP